MPDIEPISAVIGIVVTWGIGLATPLLIRYAILKRAMNKWPAIGICALFLLLNNILAVALGGEVGPKPALILIAFVSYWILRKTVVVKERTQ